MLVAVLLADDTDRAAVLQCIRPNLTFISHNTASAVRANLRPEVHAVLCEPALDLLDDDLLNQIETSGIRLILRLDPTTASIRTLISLSSRFPGMSVSLRSPVRGTRTVGSLLELLSYPDGGPVAPVVSRLREGLSEEAAVLLVAALVLGRTRVDGGVYAAVCGMAPRTCQITLKRLGLPCPHRLLKWGQTFWAAWRMQQWRMTCKGAAAAGGFSRASEMAVALRPTMLMTPSEFASRGSWGALFDRYSVELARDE